MKLVPPDSPHLFDPTDGPNFAFEEGHADGGRNLVCGVDEAGRGPLAGPVVAAAVILDPNNVPHGLNDSKKLSEKKREELFNALMRCACVSVSSVSASTIDRINVRAASLLAMTHSIQALEVIPSHALIDGNALPDNLPCEATTLVKGDSRSVSIAAASIIAKVTRDRMMMGMAENYPHYEFEKHKGYGTKVHMDALAQHGPCPLHRMTFAPVAAARR